MAKPPTLASCSLDFEFPCFSKLPSNVGKCTFSPAVELMGKRWRLCLYPGGNNEESKDYLGCFLQCTSAGSISVSFRLSVINHGDGKPFSTVLTKENYEFTRASGLSDDVDDDSKAYGWPKHTLRSRLDDDSHALVNDVLIVRLELSTSPRTSSAKEIRPYDLSALYNDQDTADIEIHVPIDSDSDDDDEDSRAKNIIVDDDGRSFAVLKAHRLILGAFSEYFKEKLLIREAKQLIIYDSPKEAVEGMLSFCYGRDFALEDYEWLQVLDLSCTYQIKALTAKCVAYLMNILSEKNAIEMLGAFNRQNLPDTEEEIMKFIADHPNSIVQGADELEYLDEHLLIDIMTRAASAEQQRQG